MKRLAWWLVPFPCLVCWAVWSGMAWPIGTTFARCWPRADAPDYEAEVL